MYFFKIKPLGQCKGKEIHHSKEIPSNARGMCVFMYIIPTNQSITTASSLARFEHLIEDYIFIYVRVKIWQVMYLLYIDIFLFWIILFK